MNTPEHGPVSVADLREQVTQLHDLAARAADNGQDDYSLIFLLTADSLESNAENMGLFDDVSGS